MLALGVALLVLGLVLLVVEAHAPTAGALGAVGAVVLGAGVWLTLAEGGVAAAVAVPAGIAAGAATGALTAVASRKALAAQHLPVRSGPARFAGRTARVRTWNGTAGQVELDGEVWRARLALAQEEDRPPGPGDRVVVEHAEDLTLFVRRCEPWELEP